jgi:phosphatidate phosphatase LPIN
VSALGLRPGKNVIAFSFQSRVWGRQEVQAHAYLWDWNAKVVVSDVDGTITKSDVLGHLAPMVGKDWNHAGVATLYNNIKDNGYQLMFLSSRAISQSKNTRQYLEKLTQDGETLTQGPVMLAPDPLSTALYREVVVRRPQEFKMRCLSTIRDLFPPEWNPFYAGFGNRETDTVSYASVGVPPGRNFTINPKSEVVAEVTKMTKRYTLAGINELVDEMFPAVEESVDINVPAECDQFGDCQFWKKDIPEIDLDDLP